ncbi:MAG: sugar phosphate isomerase/epimerase [Oscillospiraceae bacterium]|nr:sugar phosphate isomerase/epimerase [Oscillospiraceae bacterium]
MKWLVSTTADLDIEMLEDGSYRTRNGELTLRLAREYGTGLEIAEFCMGDSLGKGFDETDRLVRHKLSSADGVCLHAPFNELFPSAIDEEAAALAEKRYAQALMLADGYGISKVVIHSGYAPSIYFDAWFLEQSVRFWKAFLAKHQGHVDICLENVMESSPAILKELMEALQEPRIGLCLDIGHAFRCSRLDPIDWLEELSPWLRHFHIHDNKGEYDTHEAPGQGCINVDGFLKRAQTLCPEATYTIESLDAEKACFWLREHGYL